MGSIITGKSVLKVALMINIAVLIVMVIGAHLLIKKSEGQLEKELSVKGEQQSLIGAKMIGVILEEAIDNGVFPVEDVFDTVYEKIGDFDPPKYHTKYDTYLDKAILKLQDEFLKDESILYAVGVDGKGYVPTHNSRYQQPFTGDPEKDKIGNRTKQLFNDEVGLKAAQNLTPAFMQVYQRDTGETVWDIASPIYVKGKHWGNFRIGISPAPLMKAKRELSATLFLIIVFILSISVVLTYLLINHFLVAPYEFISKSTRKLSRSQLRAKVKVPNSAGS